MVQEVLLPILGVIWEVRSPPISPIVGMPESLDKSWGRFQWCLIGFTRIKIYNS
jgi:hypothetical protein